MVLNNTPPPASVAVSSGSPQSATVYGAFNPLVVVVDDADGNPVPGHRHLRGPDVGASATLSSSTVVTGADGQASVTATADTVAGSYAVTASVSGVTTPASFGLTNLPPITMSPAGAARDGGRRLQPADLGQRRPGGPYTFAITAGAMPVGFTLSPQGLLSGASTLAQTLASP